MRYKTLIIMGEAGSGKDRFLRELLEQAPDLNKVVGCTTRPQREGEISGKEHFFVNESLFNGIDMLETEKFNNWWYGTPMNSFREDCVNVKILTPSGANFYVNNDKIEVIGIMWLRAKPKTRLIRQLNREENPNVNEIIRRYQTDAEDFKKENFMFIPVEVKNETEKDLENALNFALGIIEKFN